MIDLRTPPRSMTSFDVAFAKKLGRCESVKEAAQGGMVTISMRVPVRCLLCGGRRPACERCGGKGAVYQLYSAWLAVVPEIADGTLLAPTAMLGGMLRPVRFRIRIQS